MAVEDFTVSPEEQLATYGAIFAPTRDEPTVAPEAGVPTAPVPAATPAPAPAPVTVPAMTALPPGAAFTYSVPPGADLARTRQVSLPGGLTRIVPQGAQNLLFTQGRPADPIEQAVISGRLPMGQAERAIAGAMHYQAIRGYQRDLAEGKPAQESLVRWAPLMFSQQPAAIAAINRYSAQPTMTERTFGGQPFVVTQQPGQATRLTQVRVPPAAFTPGPVQAQPVFSPGTTNVIPGLVSVPGSRGMVTRTLPEYQRPMSPDREINILLRHNADLEKAGIFAYKGASPERAAQAAANKKVYDQNTARIEELRRGIGRTVTAPAPVAGTERLPTVTTQAQFDALAPGSRYIGRDGKTYRKPGVQDAG